MKKFLLKLLGLLLILLVISIAIEVLLLYKTNIYSYKHQYVLSHKDEIKVLVMGNSHILYSIIPDSVGDGVFNHAIPARPVYYDVELIKQYVPLLNNLEVVIMPLDYQRFYLGREVVVQKTVNQSKEESTIKCMYFKYMNVRTNWWYWPELLNSKLNYMSRIIMTDESARECDSLGYQMLSLKNKKKRWECSTLPKHIDSTKTIDQKAYDQLYCYYKDMAQVTYNNKIRLILLGTPMYKTFWDNMNDVIVRDRERFVSKLKATYPNVEYYDFTCDIRFNPDDFYNTNHLTEVGAAKFSKIIKEILERRCKRYYSQ